MKCKVKYIENQYRKDYPKLADKLTDVYHDIWRDITESKLFTKYGEGDNATYLFSKVGTEKNNKQIAFIRKMSQTYGGPVINSRFTQAGNNMKVVVDVHPIAKQEWMKLNPQQSLFQLKGGTESSTASPAVLSSVKDFLKRIGVGIETLENIYVDGVRQNANGAAMIAQKLIQIADGKEDVALTEEAMHFAVEIIEQKDPKLFNQLLKEINDYRILNQVVAEYGTLKQYQTADGKPDIRKLKKEAIGKVLAETVIGHTEGSTEKPELLAKVENWWQKIINFFKGLIQESGFDTAAMKILTGEEIGTVEDVRAKEGDIYYQSSSDIQDRVMKNLQSLQGQLVKKEDGYYIDGKKVPRRVSDLVQDWYERRFKAKDLTKSDYAKAVDDLKAEKGTKGHSDIEYAFSTMVDTDGYLRPTRLNDDNYISQLDPNDRSAYELLRDNLQERLNSFPPNTRFMSEVMVYDPKRGIAGTIDFLAVTPQGKINILDWKFSDINIEKSKGDIPWYKVNAWNQQMEQYKLILQNTNNLKGTDFGQTRMIPIKTHYIKGDAKAGILPMLDYIEIGDVDVKNIKQDYLIPVGLENESTGNKKIDALLEKLNAVYKQLSDNKVLPSEKLNKAEQLNSLFTAIRQLQMKQNIKPLVNQAKVLNKQIQNTIDTYNNKWKGADAKSFTTADIDNFSDLLIDAENALQTYTSLDTDLRFLFTGKELTEEDKELRESVRDAADNARDLQATLEEITGEFAEEIIAKRQDIDNLLSPEKIVKGLSKWFSSTSVVQTKAVQTLFRMANTAFGYAAQDTLDETKRLQKLKVAYDELARQKGWTVKNYFDILKKKDKNELIDQYNPEFYSELRKHIDNKDFEWVRANVNVSEYNKHLDERLAEEYQRIEDKARLEEGPELEKIINREKEEAKRMLDTSTTDGIGWLQYDLLKKFPKDTWESSEWKELKNNKAAKDFYDYIIERNKMYSDIGYIHAKEARTFLPWVRKGMMEKLLVGGDIKLGEEFLRNISIDESDIGYGQIDPLTGKPIDRIPIYLTKKIEGEVSTDLFRTMSLYNEMAIRFKHLSDIEAQARLLVDVEKNKKAIATSMFGKTVYKDGQLQYTPDNNENTELLDKMVKGIIYGQKYLQSESFDQLMGKLSDFGERANKKMGMKIFPENLSGRQISLNKAFTQLNNVFQLNTLGLNVLSATSNMFGGTAQSIINAGTYFTKADYASMELWLFGNKMTGGADKKKAIAALEYFLPLTDNYNKEIAKTLSVSKLSQENIQEFLMVLMRNTDKAVQTTNFFSFLKNSIVVDDEVVNARQYLREQPEYQNKYEGTAEDRKKFEEKFEEDVQKLIEEKGVMKLSTIDEDGKLVIPGVKRQSESVINLRRSVQSLSKDALGNLSEDDIRLINLNIYGKSFMMFKNWIPRLADVRYGNLKYNAASDAYEWGRMRNTFRIISEDLLGSFKNLKNTLMANEKGVEFMKDLYEKKKADYEADTGKELKMTQVEFMDMVNKNIKGQLLDTIFLLTLFALYAGLKANAPDDGDDRAKNQHKFIMRGADKLRDELLYFYNPTSITGLVSTGVFPAVGLIENFEKVMVNFGKENYYILTGDKEKQDKNYVIKYLMSTFPMANQAKSWLPMFYPDVAKDLGIRAQSQSGFIR